MQGYQAEILLEWQVSGLMKKAIETSVVAAKIAEPAAVASAIAVTNVSVVAVAADAVLWTVAAVAKMVVAVAVEIGPVVASVAAEVGRKVKLKMVSWMGASSTTAVVRVSLGS
eukprot:Gb_24171 [translate_table: standard]